MTSNLFPGELLSLTKEHHVVLHSKRSLYIYNLLVSAVIIFILILPFLFIEVSVKCAGILKAATELTILRATSTGVVKEVFVKENMTVKRGQLLFEVHSSVLEEKEKYFNNKLEEIRMFLNDLQHLTAPHFIEHSRTAHLRPMTALYRQSISDYGQKLVDRQTRFQKIKQDYKRNKKLYDVNVIAEAEFENFRYELDKAEGDVNLLKQTQLSAWQQELHNYENELADFQSQLNQVYREKENLNVIAPINGTIQNLAGIYPGSQIFSNQDLGQISPDTSLVAEVYVSPNDIGLLHEDMNVRMQVSAFNYNQWGLLHGKIQEISNDIQTANNQSFFEVRCTLDQDYLSLKNGYQGKLKKGMTLQARFVVIKRSLWQLLYDKVDDWMNPNIL